VADFFYYFFIKKAKKNSSSIFYSSMFIKNPKNQKLLPLSLTHTLTRTTISPTHINNNPTNSGIAD
jgi:hypothetical protein